MAPTQAALYGELADDLHLSWSEAELPERERTKHVHRLHPYLGKFVPQLVEALLERYVRARWSRARPVRRLRDDARAMPRVRIRRRRRRRRSVQLPAHAREDGATTTSSGSRPICATRSPGVGRLARARPSGYVREWFAPQAAAELLHFRSIVDEYEHADVLRVVLARAARSARLTTHFDLDFPRAPQREPYWCHKHRRECAPVQEAGKFLSRYLLDTLERIKSFQRCERADAARPGRARRLHRRRARRLVRRDRHLTAVPGPDRLPRAAPIRVRAPRARRPSRARARRRRARERAGALSRTTSTGISRVLARSRGRLEPAPRCSSSSTIVAISTRRSCERSGLRLVDRLERHVNRRTGPTRGRVLRVGSGLCTGNVRDPCAPGSRPISGVAWPRGLRERGTT